PKAHEITGPGAVAPVLVGLPVAVVLDHLLPGGQEPRRVPASIRERGPGAPRRRRGETNIGERRENRPTALEQAPTQERPQEVEKAEVGSKRHISHDTRQNMIDPVEYGGHQVSPFSKRCAGTLTLPEVLPDVVFTYYFYRKVGDCSKATGFSQPVPDGVQ